MARTMSGVEYQPVDQPLKVREGGHQQPIIEGRPVPAVLAELVDRSRSGRLTQKERGCCTRSSRQIRPAWTLEAEDRPWSSAGGAGPVPADVCAAPGNGYQAEEAHLDSFCRKTPGKGRQ
jgi:hypothetical protein